MSCALLLLFVPLAPARGELQLYQSPHFDLYIDTTHAFYIDATQDVLEAGYKELSKIIGKPRAERLKVVIVANQEDYKKELERIGNKDTESLRAQGIYDHGRQSIYMWRTPNNMYTRRVLLHELAHQIAALSHPEYRRGANAVFCEGLAEYLSLHRWNDTELTLPVLPQVAPMGFGAAAADRFEKKWKGDISALALCPDEYLSMEGYGEACTLVAFLSLTEPGILSRWTQHLYSGESREAAWKAAVNFGDQKALSRKYVAWAREHGGVLQAYAGEWAQSVDDDVEAYTSPNLIGCAISLKPLRELSISGKTMDENSGIGIAVTDVGNGVANCIVVQPGVGVFVADAHDVTAGGWVHEIPLGERIKNLTVGDDREMVVFARQEGDVVIVEINGRRITVLFPPQEFRLGIAALGHARFDLSTLRMREAIPRKTK